MLFFVTVIHGLQWATLYCSYLIYWLILGNDLNSTTNVQCLHPSECLYLLRIPHENKPKSLGKEGITIKKCSFMLKPLISFGKRLPDCQHTIVCLFYIVVLIRAWGLSVAHNENHCSVRLNDLKRRPRDVLFKIKYMLSSYPLSNPRSVALDFHLCTCE